MRFSGAAVLSRRRAFASLGVLSIVFVQGCYEAFPPPPPPEAAPPSPAAQGAALPEPKPYGCANRRNMTPGQPSPVTLEALRKAVDSSDDATTGELVNQLGQARVRNDTGEPGVSEQEYEKLGLRLEVERAGDKQVIKSVELLGRPYWSSWAGSLPEGLSFAMNVQDTFGALGLPDEKAMRTYANSPHHYRTRGLLVRFDTDGCLESVGFIRKIAPKSIRFGNVRSDATQAEKGLTGVYVGVTRALGEWIDPNAQMRLALELRDEKGEPIHALDAQGNDAGPLRAEQNDFAADEIRRVFFVPFSAMRLAPGPHTLRVEFSARAADASGVAVPLEASGGPFTVAFEMPPLRRARIGVLRVEATPGVYDSQFSLPDLRWNVSSESLGFIRSFTSKTREDTLSASWSERTPWLVFATNDHIELCVEDEDVLDAETIGCFSLTLDEAISAAKEKKRLSARRVERLTLAAPVVSPVATR